MGFSSKNTGVDCHVLLQGIFLTQGLNPTSLTSPALAGGFFTTSATWEACFFKWTCIFPLISFAPRIRRMLHYQTCAYNQTTFSNKVFPWDSFREVRLFSQTAQTLFDFLSHTASVCPPKCWHLFLKASERISECIFETERCYPLDTLNCNLLIK